MTDPSPPRSVAGPLVLAVVFLAIIGGSVGVIMGLTGGRGGEAGSGPPDTGSSASTATAGPATPSDSPGRTTAPPTSAPAGRRCLAHTERLAGRELAQVLYVRARNGARRIEVWICQDAGGKLYYQGHEGTPDDRELVEGSDALFLRDVTERPDGYEAVNTTSRGQTRYRVSAAKVAVGSTEFTVTYHEP
jgi:hypothetical protein